MKITAVLGFAIIMSLTSNAQNKYGVGIKSGLNFATIKTSGSSGRMGVHVGGYYYKMFTPVVGMQTELTVSQAGGSIYNQYRSADMEYQLTYLTLPLSLRLQWRYLVINAGVQAWVLMHEGSTGINSDDIKSTDFALFCGPGLEFPFGLTVGLSSVWGTSNILRESDYSQLYTNYVFQVSVGYTLVRKKR